MASNSHAESRKQSKSKGVTAQHTLERVRNNQRRHRARRRDYISMLEQKLGLAEQSVRALQEQVDALQAELAQFRNKVSRTAPDSSALPDELRGDNGDSSLAPPSNPQEIDIHALNLLPDVDDPDISTLATPLPVQLQLPDELSAELGTDVTPLHTRPENFDEPTQCEILRALIPLAQSPVSKSEPSLAVVPMSYSASDLALQTTDDQLTSSSLSARALPNLSTTTAGTCCSEERTSELDNNRTSVPTIIFSRENSPLLPGYLIQPATEPYYRYNTEGESTMLCAEACLLIEQQNFRGFSRQDVVTWLRQGFRLSVRHDEGCRVKTDLLFSLLSFISDV